MQRLATVLREIARGGLAGLIAGLVVGGIGGRLAMSAAAMLNPDATGALTENGEVVGRFTLQGTLALLIFGGLASGAFGAVAWVIISPWLPTRLSTRALLSIPVAICLGSFILIEATNSDFLILGPTPLIVGMLLALVGIAGPAIVLVDAALERRLPMPGSRPDRAALAYGIVTLLGTPALVLTLAAFFSPAFAATGRPPGVGLALLVVGAATLAAWLIRAVRGDAPVPPPLTWAARLALLGAVSLGGLHLANQIAWIFYVASS